ncbi:MAG TPA: hypothetical protein VEB60_01685 [Candidatus Paceibacterota bacterium]|nr:hypothetical protein [Candidatus Paceibacterota bacterium]
MHKKAKKIIALVTLTAAFLFVAVGLNSATSSAAVYYGGNYILASSYYVTPGQDVTITGHRFYPNEKVTVSAGSMSKQVTADGSGAFSATFKVPYVPGDGQGNLEVRASGDMSRMEKSMNVVIAGFYPEIAPSSYFIYPHETVTWSGSGFAPGEAVKVYKNGAMIASVIANGGSFSGVSISTHSVGTENYSFVGQTSGARISRSITVGDPWWD